jgi:hypothetical protein
VGSKSRFSRWRWRCERAREIREGQGSLREIDTDRQADRQTNRERNTGMSRVVK